MNMVDAARLIALDWGTSSLRALLLGDAGAVLAQRSAPLGIMRVPPGGFPDVFAQIAGDWRRSAPHLPAIASGMVGSAQGWEEVPYCDGAAGLAEMAGGLRQVPAGDGGTLHIVPGVSLRQPRPEVMRGEETQIFGAMALQPALCAGARLLLPGTHSKWVDLSAGRISGFQTFMTGELFAVLQHHSILGRFARESGADTPPDDAAFEQGLAAAQASEKGIAGLLFSARARVLLGAMPASGSLSFLSGLLIGEELRCALSVPTRRVVLIGEAGLVARYRHALACFGVDDTPAIAGAAEAGLWHIARTAGLVS
ncbi:2-dehydro-3-deoxygalactonokinase [Cupriavidus taiwanensis]|uniref:2-keto-3-deoxy-galactonokinase n=1 Tax=Cupriavidus taiwanensis TaxID=164546 RepID=A0A375IUR6_9BURK|nr:2-dehydro-3-deoxygalactonokinase [Cupriavidus taiwanensis]SPR96384.1 2-keto-3-deoxy-galactonokinase [Cupriavidus taiwanensis]